MKEEWLVWINPKQELIHYDKPKKNLMKLTHINNKPLGFTIDWLERSLYYVEYNNGSTVVKVDLNYLMENERKVNVFSRRNKIVGITISPFTKRLYWIELKQNKSLLMESTVDGMNIRPFFKERLTSKDYNKICNCSNTVAKIEPFFVLDHSYIPFKPQMILVDSQDRQSRRIISSDSDGCSCQIISKNISLKYGDDMRNLIADSGMIYWTSQRELNVLNRSNNVIFNTKVTIFLYTFFINIGTEYSVLFFTVICRFYIYRGPIYLFRSSHSCPGTVSLFEPAHTFLFHLFTSELWFWYFSLLPLIQVCFHYFS